MCHISQTFSQSKTAGKMHKLQTQSGLSLNYTVEIPVCSAKNWDTVCTRIKNENSDYLIVLKIDIWKTEYCQLSIIHFPNIAFLFGDFCAWNHVRLCQFVCVLFHLYAIHAQSCVIGNSEYLLVSEPVNPLMNHKSLYLSKFTAFALDKLNVGKNDDFSLLLVRKHCGKRRNAGYQHFSFSLNA